MGCSESKVGGETIAAYDNGKKVTMGSPPSSAPPGPPGDTTAITALPP